MKARGWCEISTARRRLLITVKGIGSRDWRFLSRIFIFFFFALFLSHPPPPILLTMDASTPATYPPWPWTTPLGLPVLPEVYETNSG